jgi:hypothetical protein
MARKKRDPFKNDKARLRYYELEGFIIIRVRCGECRKAQFLVKRPEEKFTTSPCMFCQKHALKIVTQ